MTFIVRELPKARSDKRRIVEWLIERSLQGAAAWLDAYDQMVERLKTQADALPVAHESRELDLEVRQILFKTRGGRVYRAVYYVEAKNVYILRVRGPGQADIIPGDLVP
ncbi:MAG: type II toxin-antitoxin system RelE/ParE family toxin [Pirellulales bacterium]